MESIDIYVNKSILLLFMFWTHTRYGPIISYNHRITKPVHVSEQQCCFIAFFLPNLAFYFDSNSRNMQTGFESKWNYLPKFHQPKVKTSCKLRAPITHTHTRQQQNTKKNSRTPLNTKHKQKYNKRNRNEKEPNRNIYAKRLEFNGFCVSGTYCCIQIVMLTLTKT